MIKLPTRSRTQRSPHAKIRAVEKSIDNVVAASMNNGLKAWRSGQTRTVVPATVAHGDANLFMAPSFAAIPTMVKILRARGITKPRISVLGDGKGTDALTINIHRAHQYLQETGRSVDSLKPSELLQLAKDILITRFDIHSFTKAEEDKAISHSLASHIKVQQSLLDIFNSIRTHFIGNKGPKSRADIQPGSLLSDKRNRKALLGEVVIRDLRQKPPKASDITTVGQLLHYFQTVPPKEVDPYTEIPMSDRAKFFSHITKDAPHFILFDDSAKPIGYENGVRASMLSHGYVPDQKLSREYAWVKGTTVRPDDRKETQIPKYTIYRHDPERAEQIRASKAKILQKAWRAYPKKREAREERLKELIWETYDESKVAKLADYLKNLTV